LSVAVVTYRTPAAMLARALESLARAAAEARAAAGLMQVRVFVIDNSPREAHEPVMEGLRAWPAEAGPLELLHGHGNVGYGRANNLVLDRLDSDLHLVINPDIELAPEALVEALRTLAAHPEAGLLAPAVFGADGARQYLCKRYPSVWVLFLRGFAPAALRRRGAGAIARYEMRDVIGDHYVDGVPLASGCFMLVRTALFREVGGFDPRFFMYFEDYDLSMRISRQARLAYAPGVRIVHGGGEAARKGARHVGWFMASAARFFSRYGWKFR
ncbi:MAG TPA: glycosyltransferase family 2 protein, partial [Usitatibacter sp.]|nr:glycosyltransferase family 2 protein [Usitatibacter sp.]